MTDIDTPRRLTAAKHLVSTSSLAGTVDMDRLFDEIIDDERFYKSEQEYILFCVLRLIMSHWAPVQLGEVLNELDDLDRQAALEALVLVFTTKEVLA